MPGHPVPFPALAPTFRCSHHASPEVPPLAWSLQWLGPSSRVAGSSRARSLLWRGPFLRYYSQPVRVVPRGCLWPLVFWVCSLLPCELLWPSYRVTNPVLLNQTSLTSAPRPTSCFLVFPVLGAVEAPRADASWKPRRPCPQPALRPPPALSRPSASSPLCGDDFSGAAASRGPLPLLVVHRDLAAAFPSRSRLGPL